VFPTSTSTSRWLRLSPSVVLGTNLQRRSDVVLDQPLVDKIHAPSTNLSSRGFFGCRHSVLLENTHSSQMYSFRRSMPDLQTAGCPRVTSDLCPASLTLRFDRVHRQAYDLVSYRIWIDCRFVRERHCCSPVEEPTTFTPPVFPFATTRT
jgi:hypothetical protein